MAKQTLPVNFKDDILAPSMGGKRKFTITDNGDGTYEIEDATDYTQTGSDFGAGQINATNQAVNESCDKADVIDDLDDIVANQANGKIAGAKALATLNADLSDLISKLNPKSYDISSINLMSAWEVRYYDIHKIGRLVIFHARIYAETILALHEYTINTEVDSDLIPLSVTPISAIAGDIYMQHTVACKCTLYEDGLIKLEVPDSGKNYIDISCVYMT